MLELTTCWSLGIFLNAYSVTINANTPKEVIVNVKKKQAPECIQRCGGHLCKSYFVSPYGELKEK